MDRNRTKNPNPPATNRPQCRDLTEAELDDVSGGSSTGGSAFEIKDWSFGVTNTSTIGSP